MDVGWWGEKPADAFWQRNPRRCHTSVADSLIQDNPTAEGIISRLKSDLFTGLGLICLRYLLKVETEIRGVNLQILYLHTGSTASSKYQTNHWNMQQALPLRRWIREVVVDKWRLLLDDDKSHRDSCQMANHLDHRVSSSPETPQYSSVTYATMKHNRPLPGHLFYS